MLLEDFFNPWIILNMINKAILGGNIHQSPQTKVDSESSISKNPSRICFPVCSPEFIDEAWWTTNCAWVPPTLILASTASSSLSVSDLLPSCRRSMWVWHFPSDRPCTYRTYPRLSGTQQFPMIFVGSLWILLRVPGFSMSNESDTRPRISWWLVMNRSEVNHVQDRLLQYLNTAEMAGFSKQNRMHHPKHPKFSFTAGNSWPLTAGPQIFLHN